MSSASKRKARLGTFRRAGKPSPAPARGSSAKAPELDLGDADEVVEAEVDDEAISEVAGGNEEKALFPGDTSTLPYDVRRAYTLLLRGPSLDERHSKLWPVLLNHEDRIRQLLHAAFLDLVIDREQMVAFTRPVDAPELEAPQLLREVRLTFLDTAVVLFLRMKLTQADAAGERATISRSEIAEHLKAYEASDNVDRSRFARQVDNAIEKAKKYNFLRLIRNSGDRFEVSPALKLVFSAEQVRALLKAYRQLSGRDEAGAERGSEAQSEMASLQAAIERSVSGEDFEDDDDEQLVA